MKRANVDSSLEDFLREEGLLVDAVARAANRRLVRQIERARKRARISKDRLAKRIRVSRSRLDRLLGPDSRQLTILHVVRIAKAVGARLQFKVAPWARATNPAKRAPTSQNRHSS